MKYFFLALSVVMVFMACNKTPTVTANRENLLRSKKWKISGGTLTVKKPNGRDTILKYMDYLPDCYKDDYLKFDSMRYGTIFTGGVSCNVADPASHSFVWQLLNNDMNIDLYNGFNNIFTAADTIQPYHFDTIQKTPYLVLDTLVRRIDTTPGFLKVLIALDTIRELRFRSKPLTQFDIYGATITEFTESSFTLNFSCKGLYPDSTGWHAGGPYNFEPIYREDTMHYKLTYSGF